MKKRIKEIDFVSSKQRKFQFDYVSYQDLLKKNPTDHSQFEFHKLSFYVILLCTQDKGKYNLNFKEHDLKKGTLFTLRKDNIHKFYKSNADGVILVFTDNFILNHSTELEASKTFLLFNEMLASPKLELDDVAYQEILALVNLIKAEYADTNDDYSLSIIRSYIQVIITKLFRIKSKDNVVFDQHKYLSDFLELQSLVEKEWVKHKTVSYYAKKLGVTTKTLNNVTQSIIHKSAKTFINEIVITQSKRLIIQSQDSLTEIAYQVGFEDPTNFFKYFRKYTEVSPSEFRALHQSV